jgi:hypothetical protein
MKGWNLPTKPTVKFRDIPLLHNFYDFACNAAYYKIYVDYVLLFLKFLSSFILPFLY